MAEYDVEFDEVTQDGYRMVVIRRSGGHYCRHRCGYVSVPAEHPFFGKDYDQKIKVDLSTVKVNDTDPVGTFLAACDAKEDNGEVSIGYLAHVHGGITYASDGAAKYPVDAPGSWWFGFDAAHHGDDDDGGRPLSYMIEECRELAEFLRSLGAKQAEAA